MGMKGTFLDNRIIYNVSSVLYLGVDRYICPDQPPWVLGMKPVIALSLKLVFKGDIRTIWTKNVNLLLLTLERKNTWNIHSNTNVHTKRQLKQIYIERFFVCYKCHISYSINRNIGRQFVFLLWGGPSWPWSYGSWIYNYLCNQCLSPLMWVRISIRARWTWYNIMW